jgi:hypothetical protein
LKTRLLLFFINFSLIAGAQEVIKREGGTYTNSDSTWLGVNINRTVPAKFIFKNNSITSSNTLGYLLLAGDEGPTANDNNLDGSVITGNRFNWIGTDMKCITHGLFTGHQRNVVIMHNYLNDVPMAIIRKSSNNMSDTGGGIAYNIVKGGAVGINIKGLSNVRIYNNTLYQDRTPEQTWRPLIFIYKNTDRNLNSAASGTKIYNNILYTKHQTLMISIAQTECLTDFECDYNVYYCENGEPRFSVAGKVLNFAEWQAMGYDKNSVVMDPQFTDLVNFAPKRKLNFGKKLDAIWQYGLSTSAVWSQKDPALQQQKGTWQIGAVVLKR